MMEGPVMCEFCRSEEEQEEADLFTLSSPFNHSPYDDYCGHPICSKCAKEEINKYIDEQILDLDDLGLVEWETVLAEFPCFESNVNFSYHFHGGR